MSATEAVDFSTRVGHFRRHGYVLLALTLGSLFGVGFLLLYLSSLVDREHLSYPVRFAAFVVCGGILLLPLILGVRRFQKLYRRYGLICKKCGGNLLSNREMVQHVTQTSVCPYCGNRINDQ